MPVSFLTGIFLCFFAMTFIVMLVFYFRSVSSQHRVRSKVKAIDDKVEIFQAYLAVCVYRGMRSSVDQIDKNEMLVA